MPDEPQLTPQAVNPVTNRQPTTYDYAQTFLITKGPKFKAQLATRYDQGILAISGSNLIFEDINNSTFNVPITSCKYLVDGRHNLTVILPSGEAWAFSARSFMVPHNDKLNSLVAKYPVPESVSEANKALSSQTREDMLKSAASTGVAGALYHRNLGSNIVGGLAASEGAHEAGKTLMDIEQQRDVIIQELTKRGAAVDQQPPGALFKFGAFGGKTNPIKLFFIIGGVTVGIVIAIVIIIGLIHLV